MKNKPILKLNRLAMIIPAVLVLLSLSSCQQEEPYSNRTPSGSTLVNLSVSASNSDVTLVSDDPASAIKSLCILQFNANGNDFGPCGMWASVRRMWQVVENTVLHCFKA